MTNTWICRQIFNQLLMILDSSRTFFNCHLQQKQGPNGLQQVTQQYTPTVALPYYKYIAAHKNFQSNNTQNRKNLTKQTAHNKFTIFQKTEESS